MKRKVGGCRDGRRWPKDQTTTECFCHRYCLCNELLTWHKLWLENLVVLLLLLISNNFSSFLEVHLGIDALLISAFLAGIRRTTGLTCVSFIILQVLSRRSVFIIIDLPFHKSQTKMFAVSHYLCLVCHYIFSLSEILRSYLETGMVVSTHSGPVTEVKYM